MIVCASSQCCLLIHFASFLPFQSWTLVLSPGSRIVLPSSVPFTALHITRHLTLMNVKVYFKALSPVLSYVGLCLHLAPGT